MPNAMSEATNRRAILGAIVTAGAAIGLPDALASASAPAVPSLVAAIATASLAPISNELRAAIDAHRLAQTNVDGHCGEPEEAFSALSDLEGEAHWRLAETPCATDADFIAKIAYLLRHEQRLWGETIRTYDGQYGALAFAVELHLEERDEWRSA